MPNDVILRFIVDPQSQRQTEKSIKEIEKMIGGVGSTSLASFGGRVFSSKDLQIGQEIVKLSREWGVSISEVAKELENTQQGYNKNRYELEDLADAFKEVNRQADNTTQTTEKLSGVLTGVGGFTLIRLGRDLDKAGRSLLSPIEKFLEVQGETSAVGSQWLDDTRRISESTARIGGVMASQILPTLDRAADLSEKIASLVEAHPELAQAAVGLGVGLIGIGGLVTAVGELATGIGALQAVGFLGKTGLAGGGLAAGLGTSIAGVLTSPAVVTAISLAIGTAAGKQYGNFLGRVAYGDSYQEQSLKDALRTGLRTPFAAPAAFANQFGDAGGNLGEFAQTLGDVARFADNAISSLLGFNKELDKTAERDNTPTKAAVDAYIDFVKQQSDAERQYMEDRKSVIEAGLQRIADIESNYASQRAQIIESYNQQVAQAQERFAFQQTQAAAQFALSQQRAQEDYYLRRNELAQNYNEEVQRAEEEHQQRIRKIQRESNDRIADLVAARDALGIVREKRRAERERQDEEDRYRLEARRRNRDFARKLEQLEEQFRLEQARRAQDFAIRQQQAAAQFALQQQFAREQFEARLEQLDEEHQIELEQARQATREKLEELQRGYQEERIARRNAFFDQLRDLQETLVYERETRQAYYAAMQADLVAFLSNFNGTFVSNLPSPETHALGGYGPGYTGPGEYVLNRSTTRALEQIAGHRLSQASVLAAAGAVNGGSTYNVSFPGGLVTAKQMKDYVGNEFSRFTNQVTAVLSG